MWKKISLVICLIELLVIAALGKGLLERQNQVLAAKDNHISRETVVFTSIQGLNYFYEFKPNQVIEHNRPWLGFVPKFTINLDNLNERYDYLLDKPTDTFRIMTLGDSHTAGLFVDTANNYPEQLEQILSRKNCQSYHKIEVINLGMPGYDLKYSLERFLHRGKKYQPDLIIWLIKDDDFWEINEETRKRLGEVTEQLKREGKDLSRPNAQNYAPAGAIAMQKTRAQLGEKTIDEYQLKALRDLSPNYKGKVLILTYPNSLDKVKKYLQETVGAIPDRYFYRELPDIFGLKLNSEDMHPNQAGYKLMSEDIYKALNEKGILSCE